MVNYCSCGAAKTLLQWNPVWSVLPCLALVTTHPCRLLLIDSSHVCGMHMQCLALMPGCSADHPAERLAY